ncbi:hypothetical protein GC170_00870 [bacterium]|nr:hypothetical protein [bacterium]
MRLRLSSVHSMACLIVVIAGCGGGDGLDRQPVSGTVTFDGAPLKEGQIQFFPAANAKDAIATGATITGGSYSIPRDIGPIPGTYSVQITASGGEQAPPEGSDGMPGTGPKHDKELLPAKYNAKTTLTAEVKAGATNTIDFPLTSK